MADARDEISRIEEVSKVSQKGGAKSIGEVEDIERVAPDRDQFQTLLRQDAPPQENLKSTSLMDEVRDLHRKVTEVSKAEPERLVRQTNDIIAQIEDVKTKLQQPDIEIKGSVSSLLQNKLTHIDENLRAAINRAGSEYTVAESTLTATKNPITRFLDFLTHGQHQLSQLANDVNQMHLNKTEISPANMLAIQIKVGYVQQEIEFFTALLNKALESTKTIMNVQI